MIYAQNKIINFSNRDILSFIFKECEFSLLEIVRQIYLNFDVDSFNDSKKNIIEVPINFVFKQTLCPEMLNKPIQSNEMYIETKSSITNICNCLEPIAQKNNNRFIFKTLDINICANKILFSRLIFNLCYILLINCKKYSAIEILSYLEVEKYIIEFTTEFFLSEESINVLKTLDPLLKQLKSDFSYTVLPTKEITFTLTMPYENIRF